MLIGCCTSLPEMPPKRMTPLPSISATAGVQESSAVWRDERRGRDVLIRAGEDTGAPLNTSSI